MMLQTRQSHRKRQRPEVQVVNCPAAFPLSQSSLLTGTPGTKRIIPSPPNDDSARMVVPARPVNDIDIREATKEIRSLAATGFERKTRRAYEDEQYQLLTGRKKKKHMVPLPIVRGIRKKAQQREARAIQEAREAGLVLPPTQKNHKEKATSKRDKETSMRRVHGPAPSVGFMSKGVLRLKEKPK